MTAISTFADIELSLVIATLTNELGAAEIERIMSGVWGPERFETVDLVRLNAGIDCTGAVPKARAVAASLLDQWPCARLCVVVSSFLAHYPATKISHPKIVAVAIRHDRWEEKTLNPKAHMNLAQRKRVLKVNSINEARSGLLVFVQRMSKHLAHTKIQSLGRLSGPAK